MIDHASLSVADLGAARRFYEAALRPLGYSVVMEAGEHGIGIGPGRPVFWLFEGGRQTPPAHIAFAATSRAEVDAFHEAAVGAGGADNGGPGLRPQYHPNYYGAFVRDPEGHNIEAVCHAAPEGARAGDEDVAPLHDGP